jgi:hypothetical protein
MMYLAAHRAYPYSRHRRLGMGDAASDARAVQTVGSLSAPVISGAAAVAAAHSLAAGGTGLILGMTPALAVPIIGAAIAGITILATVLIKNSGCGQTCIETSSWANQAEPLLRQNITAYFGVAAPRTQSQQNAALANFDAIWARLAQMCGDPSTGNAGKRCISDRQSGGCTWKATADSPWPGGPPAGSCWNWFNAYRDPIANDPNVVPDSVTSVVSGAVSEISALPAWELAAAALLLVAVLS